MRDKSTRLNAFEISVTMGVCFNFLKSDFKFS